MSDLTAVLGTLLTLVVGFFLGQLAEKRKQSLAIRLEMLKPIEEWLAGIELLNGMVGDTLTLLLSTSPTPMMYDPDERLKIHKSMIQQTNRIFGILDSNALTTRSNRAFVHQLRGIIHEFENEIKVYLAHVETEMFERARTQNFTDEFKMIIFQRGARLNSRVREAHALISKNKTSLTGKEL